MSKMFKGSLLATTVIAGMSFSTAAFAQTTTTTPPPPAETPGPGVAIPGVPANQVSEAVAEGQADPQGADIVVTGTLIRNPNLVSSAPVNVTSS
ncbi:MAG: hypothetical protein M3R03_03770, partial [Pseudomonadota bacterium]|nr:hypothetical protein [Pseudomonadota bacterium]